MARKNVYLPDDLAAELAEFEDFPLSAVFQRAIREELRKMEAQAEAPETERIEVDVADMYGQTRVVAFTGRWLVEPDEVETRASQTDYGRGPSWDAGVYYGIALTRKGRIAVYWHQVNNDLGGVTDYDDLDEVEATEGAAPPSIIADARGALIGKTPVLELDI